MVLSIHLPFIPTLTPGGNLESPYLSIHTSIYQSSIHHSFTYKSIIHPPAEPIHP